MGEIEIPGRAKKRNEPVENELFYITLMVGQKRYAIETPISSPNRESIAAVMSAVVAANLPQVTGFELYACDTEYVGNRRFLMTCPVLEIMTGLQPILQKVAGAQVFRSAIPAFGAKEGGENLQAMFDELKKAGRQVL
jgi:hypothetical protein